MDPDYVPSGIVAIVLCDVCKTQPWYRPGNYAESSDGTKLVIMDTASWLEVPAELRCFECGVEVLPEDGAVVLCEKEPTQPGL